MKKQIFMVDSSDRTRWNEAKDELKKIAHAQELVHLPILVFANKSGINNKRRITTI